MPDESSSEGDGTGERNACRNGAGMPQKASPAGVSQENINVFRRRALMGEAAVDMGHYGSCARQMEPWNE